ncbi:MAG: hypothetical protein HY298_20890 [Verrucomicrobia bacterium]|nr:hypothetical protein [Verrucomicrobiota bacterium]
MKLIKINKPQVSETKEVPGLLNCRIEYEVKTAKGRLEYVGPKFAPEMWHQVLSFFRWTHKEMQSESQVRLYVNHKLGRWGAWAFPQVARTGMSARELPTPETPEQAQERFASWQSEPSDDWLYFGTVHHHCSASAFQSSTDEQNEWNQDGLHLTVGRMDAEQHDLHARLYVDGNCFEPDLSQFWPIDPGLAAMIPPGMLNELARFQMSAKVTVDFPDAWRTNMVDVQTERPSWDRNPQWGLDRSELGPLLYARVDEALEEIHRRCAADSVGEEEWLAELSTLAASEISQIIIEACVKHGVTPDELLVEMAQGPFDY